MIIITIHRIGGYNSSNGFGGQIKLRTAKIKVYMPFIIDLLNIRDLSEKERYWPRIHLLSSYQAYKRQTGWRDNSSTLQKLLLSNEAWPSTIQNLKPWHPDGGRFERNWEGGVERRIPCQFQKHMMCQISALQPSLTVAKSSKITCCLGCRQWRDLKFVSWNAESKPKVPSD